MTSPPTPDSEEVAAATADGGELLAGYDPLQLVESLLASVGPGELATAGRRIAKGLVDIALRTSKVSPAPKDFRFQDPTWAENPVYRTAAQIYLLWAEEMMRIVEHDRGDWRTAERSRFAMSAITTALSPSNTPLNPAAVKRSFETAGVSSLKGVKNFFEDLTRNRGLPSQVDPSSFTVGGNIAATPGAVVHRDSMFELLQYAPTTDSVRELPLLLLPPPVNKYYFWDLAPGRSMVEYVVAQKFSVFTMVWRDPPAGSGHLGIDDYVEAQLRAVDVVRDICGTDSVNVFGDCSGGLFEALMLGYLAARGDDSVRSATFGVTVMDFSHPSGVGMSASSRTLRQSRRRAERGEVIAAEDISSTFVWMRPNDLVWRYLINNWLLGNDPPAFDVLFWNNDGQGLPSKLAYDLGLIALENSTTRRGALHVLGQQIDLQAVKCDSYFIAGKTDHISPWKACYSGTQLLGGHREFVLASSGHVQAIINPPGNPRASFHTGGEIGADPDAWLASAEKHQGTWWPHWTAWLSDRSGDERPAPEKLGNDRHPVLGPAPGRYVLGE
jgi:polyhydroxyalkanoate synthase subunit PhaC